MEKLLYPSNSCSIGLSMAKPLCKSFKPSFCPRGQPFTALSVARQGVLEVCKGPEPREMMHCASLCTPGAPRLSWVVSLSLSVQIQAFHLHCKCSELFTVIFTFIYHKSVPQWFGNSLGWKLCCSKPPAHENTLWSFFKQVQIPVSPVLTL